MSDSERELSDSDSEREPVERQIIQRKSDTLRSFSDDDEGIDHAAPNIRNSGLSSSDNDQDFQNKENDNNENINDNENDSPVSDNERKESSEDETEHKSKKKGRKKKGKKDDENENSDEGEKVDKEIEEMVKNASKTKSAKYVEIENPEEYYESKAKGVLKKMSNALKDDYEAYANRRFSFERINYLKILKSELNNKKLAKYLLRANFLNYLAAWISPYESREGDTEPVYPIESFRIDILKLLLKLKLKPEYFEETQDGKKSEIMKILQEMPVVEGSEISKLISQVINKILRILTHADDGKVSSSLIIDKDEAAEIKRNKDSEIPSYYNKNELKLERYAQQIRKTNAADRPRDYLPPPRIINTNIKPPKRRK
ncbi:hypothetical protein M9Y10_026826 [Tritrichomonas musculus]|uniref:Uncharacterized protein n=1 Tax=Tritrichomonas musculus TaxID=1915356 RepID=A0ABR2H6L8_9EUKA